MTRGAKVLVIMTRVQKECFHKKLYFFQLAPKVAKYLVYFCQKNCCQELKKIARSGHTVAFERIIGVKHKKANNPSLVGEQALMSSRHKKWQIGGLDVGQRERIAS